MAVWRQILLSHCLVVNGYLWAVGWSIQSFLVSPAWNFCFSCLELKFHRLETLVSKPWNQSFGRLKTVVPADGMNETRQETDPLLCTSLIMVDLFISNSCYVLTRNITNPGSCLLYYLLFLPPVYLFFSYSFNRLTLLFERRKKKGTHPFSSFYPASRAFLVFS